MINDASPSSLVVRELIPLQDGERLHEFTTTGNNRVNRSTRVSVFEIENLSRVPG